MTTLPVARKAVVDAFIAAWGATTPVVLDNEVSNLHEGTASWVRLSVRHTTSEQRTLGGTGNRRFERRAIAAIQVFAPAEGFTGSGGTDAADQLAQTARRALEGVALSSGVKFQAANVREPRPDPDTQGRWWVVLVECPFTYLETA